MLDDIILHLFGEFPREVANPERFKVWKLDHFIRFVETNNGVNDCFTSVYPLDETMDKVFMDFDGPGALEDTKKLTEYLLDEKFRFITVISGKKGFHVYVFFMRHQIGEGSSLLLRRATLGIVENALGTLDCTLDPHPVGDVRRICRIPNTLRPPENLNWCCYVDPEELLTMSSLDLASYMKEPHIIDYDLSGKLLELGDLPLSDVGSHPLADKNYSSEFNKNRDIRANEVLKVAIRPCLYDYIVQPEPIHHVRVAVTIDLLQFFAPDAITNVFRSLDWLDWDSEVTTYQVDKCQGLYPYSCRKLRSLGLPNSCKECGIKNGTRPMEVLP